MRNLKRALSLALASVMLMGMMVVGSSAASINDFKDADSISNKEAVAIATGLGIFDGYEDNTFKPENVVTRAEMAVIIAKILHGADIDPSNFAGAGKFTDVPAWAEGWVNLVASLGIIEGYGDGKFGPNDTVTTVQASTMLLKALGYYVESADALGADWQLEVTSKATALGLYGDLSLGMNAGLTRENVAELTFNALFAQRVAYDDYRGLYVKSNDRNVVVTNGTDDDANTLAQNTFGLYSAEGIVVANGMTDEKLSESLKSDAQTTVVFTEETDLDQDGKFEFDVDDSYDFEYETGLDMIGHAAKIYYKLDKKEPVVFTIVDQATLVVEMANNANTTKLAAAANDAGFKKNSILDIDATDYIVNYDMDVTVDDITTWINGAGVVTATSVDGVVTLDASKTLILISNSANKQVDYVIVLDQYLDTVAEINDEDEIYLTSGDAADIDMNIAVADVEEEDYVIVTDIGNQGDVKVIDAPELVSAEITKIVGVSNTSSEVKQVIADGETYSKSKVLPFVGAALDNTLEFSAIDVIGEATLILDKDGNLIALAEEASIPNYAYVAQYGVQHSTDSLNTKDVLTAHVYFADGTNGIYTVDIKNSDLGFNKAQFEGIVDKESWLTDTMNGAVTDNYDGMTGIWNVSVSGSKIKIKTITTDVSAEAGATDVKLVKAHSTFIDTTTTPDSNVVYVNGTDTETLYNNNATIYFYVNGEYDDDLTVDVITGIKNVKGFTNDGTDGIKEAYADMPVRNERAVVTVVGIDGIVLGGASGVYYYDEGNYTVTKSGDEYVLTYTLYNEKGEKVEASYDGYDEASDAKADAANLPDGFYKIGTSNLDTYTTMLVDDGESVHSTGAVYEQVDDTQYVVNAHAHYDEYIENLFDDVNVVGAISEDAKVIDVANSGLTSLAKIAKAIKNDGDVTISYRWDNVDNYTAEVIFVTSYDPDATEAPNANVTATTYKFDTDLVATAAGAVTVTGSYVDNNGASVTLANVDKAVYTVTMTLVSGATRTYTYTDTVVAAGSSINDTIPGLTVSGTGNIYYEVDVVVYGQLANGTDVTVGGTVVIA